MVLLPKELEARLPTLYSTDGQPVKDKIAQVKFFDPCGRGTWYGVEAQREVTVDENDHEMEDVIFFGYTVSPLGSDCDEWGYFSLNELASVKNRMGLGIERDLHFKPCRIAEIPGCASLGIMPGLSNEVRR